jgi:hypothetical protein
MKRILIGGILGGIAIFVVSSILHMLTPLAHAGLKAMPNDPAIERSLKETFPKEDGLYLFPGTDMEKKMTEAEEAAIMAKYQAGPTGMLLFYPKGRTFSFGGLLAKEFISDIVLALIAAFIVSLTVASFGQRVILVTLLGFLAWLAISFSHLNWYGFPLNFELAELVDQVAGFLLCGIILAWLYRSHRATA